MKFITPPKVMLFNRNIALQDQPILWRYLQHYPKMNGFRLYTPLALSLFFTGYYGYAYYFASTGHINILKHRDIYHWIQQPNFLLFWFISLLSPFILLLKTQAVFQWRYFIAFLIIMHVYPLFFYGTAVATPIFLCSVLYPLLFEYERSKTLS